VSGIVLGTRYDAAADITRALVLYADGTRRIEVLRGRVEMVTP